MKIESYLQLLNAGSAAAVTLLRKTPEPGSLLGRAKFIYERAEELARIAPMPHDPSIKRVGIAYEALDLLVSNWPAIAAQVTSGEELLRANPRLWRRLMTEWPMGAYVELTVDFLRDAPSLRGKRILEIGAGVGTVGMRMPELGRENYVRSDLNPFISSSGVPGHVAHYDFNKRGKWCSLDLIFGVNALHCARDPALSISFLSEMLCSGGLLLLSEGQPTTTPEGTPWALNHFFGLFDGWWNVGGFRHRETWLRDLEAAGLRDVDYFPYESEGHALGGLIWGRKV